ncbi:MAG: hypothetical protein ACR2RE_14115, partial [Geminicoccaceae bacterium]
MTRPTVDHGDLTRDTSYVLKQRRVPEKLLTSYDDMNIFLLITPANNSGVRFPPPVTNDLVPDRSLQWASDQFTVKRSLILRDPSLLARGITSNITGSRADIVICDDVEVPNTCRTPARREELKNRLQEISYVLVPGGLQLYAGTPHSLNSIYAEVPSNRDSEVFLDNFQRLVLPIIDEQGESRWPERFS